MGDYQVLGWVSAQSCALGVPSLVIILPILDVDFKPSYKVCFFNVNNID